MQKEVEGFYYIASLLNLEKGDDIQKDTYDNILRQIKEAFYKKCGTKLKILTIVFTNKIEQGKNLLSDEELYWIIDTKKTQLIIYENQPMEFLGIKKGIERIIDRKKHVIEYKIEDLREEYNVSRVKHNLSVSLIY